MYQLAAMLVAFSAVMSAVAVVLGLFGMDVLPLMIFTGVFFICSKYLLEHKRWAAWLGFIFMLIGITVALMKVNTGSFAPNWVFYAVAIINVLSTVVLFGVLWKPKVSVNSTSEAS